LRRGDLNLRFPHYQTAGRGRQPLGDSALSRRLTATPGRVARGIKWLSWLRSRWSGSILSAAR